jgi:hypothetical protein
MKKVLIGLFALSSISAFANNNLNKCEIELTSFVPKAYDRPILLDKELKHVDTIAKKAKRSKDLRTLSHNYGQTTREHCQLRLDYFVKNNPVIEKATIKFGDETEVIQRDNKVCRIEIEKFKWRSLKLPKLTTPESFEQFTFDGQEKRVVALLDTTNEECMDIAHALKKQANSKMQKETVYFDNQEVILTNKKIKTSLVTVINQGDGFFKWHHKITDSLDGSYSDGFYTSEPLP